MSEIQIETLISIGIEESKARAGIAALKDLDRGLQDARKRSEETQRALAKVAEAGNKLREVAGAMGLAGGALLAPFIASAQQYSSTYGRLEKQSRAYLDAQDKIAQANARIGRTAASILTPAMEKVSSILDQVGQFMEAHPELAAAAIGGGAGLIAGAGALATVGTAVSALAKAASLIAPLIEGVQPALAAIGGVAVPIGAFTAGLWLGEKAVNALGEALDNERLKHWTLADGLTTLRQAMAILQIGGEEAADSLLLLGAKLTKDFADRAAEMRESFKDIGLSVRAGFNEILLDMTKALAGFAIALTESNPVLKAALNAVGMGDLGKEIAAQGARRYILENQDIDKGRLTNKAERIATQTANQMNLDTYTNKLLEKLQGTKEAAVKFGETGQFSGALGEQINKALGNVATFTKGLNFNNLLPGGASSATGTGVNGAGPEALNAFIAKTKADAQATRQFAEQQAKAARDYDRETAKARKELDKQLADNRRDYDKSIADAAKKYAEDRRNAEIKFAQEAAQAAVKFQQEQADALKQYQAERAKAIRDFNRSEAETEAQQQRDRIRRARDHQDELDSAAADRDVARFIEAQRNYQKQEADTADQEQADRRQRLDDFQVQLSDQQAQYDTATAQRKEQYDQETADRLAQYDAQNQQTAEQYRQELDDLRQQYDEKNRQTREQYDQESAERAEAYRQSLADMQDQFAKEKQARAVAFADQLAGLSGNIAGLSDIQAKYYSEQAAALANFVATNKAKLQELYAGSLGVSVPSSGSGNAALERIHSHKDGIASIPYDNYVALLHKGERVVPAAQNTGYDMPPVQVNIITSDVASNAAVQQAKIEIAQAVANVWRSH